MQKKMSSKNLFLSMWETHDKDENEVNVQSLVLKKSFDDICYKAELAETIQDYAFVICNGIKRLIKSGHNINEVLNHKNLMQKLFFLGKDMMESSSTQKDMFYLGAFVELKVYSMWHALEFYNFVLNALKMIKKNISFISDSIKERLIARLKSHNFELFNSLFMHANTG